MAGPKHPRHYDEAFKRKIVQSCGSGWHWVGGAGWIGYNVLDIPMRDE